MILFRRLRYMKKFQIKKTTRKGNGLLATTDIKKWEIILQKDISKLRKHSLKEISENPRLKKHSDHCDYAGHGKYVIDLSPSSYVNHSCDPNAYIEFRNLNKDKLIAIKDIKKWEEITYDVALIAIDQIRVENTDPNIHYRNMKCLCGSKNCRKVIHGDFFKLPRSTQLEKLSYLPTWIKRKFKKYLPHIA